MDGQRILLNPGHTGGSWRINGKVLLRDNRKLSQAEFKRAQRICHAVKELVINRDAYVRQNRIDPSFCYPDANWSPTRNDYLATFNRVIEADYDVINSLRLFTQFFSGYSLRHAARSEGLPSFEEISPDLDSKMEKMKRETDEWLTRWTSIVSNVPYDYIFSPPRFLGEIGWDVAGIVVNHDTYVYQERINLLYDSGILGWLNDRVSAQGRLRILEIGAGYGALALKIKSLFPACEYWICDLPECLLFSALYLCLNRPDCRTGIAERAPYGFVYMPNYMIDKIQGEFDLVINTLSFSEMSEHQLRSYAAKIKDLIRQGFLFEQNKDNRHLGFLCAQEILVEYFKFHKGVVTTTVPQLTEGNPNLWATTPINLSPVQGAESGWWKRLFTQRKLKISFR